MFFMKTIREKFYILFKIGRERNLKLHLSNNFPKDEK